MRFIAYDEGRILTLLTFKDVIYILCNNSTLNNKKYFTDFVLVLYYISRFIIRLRVCKLTYVEKGLYTISRLVIQLTAIRIRSNERSR